MYVYLYVFIGNCDIFRNFQSDQDDAFPTGVYCVLIKVNFHSKLQVTTYFLFEIGPDSVDKIPTPALDSFKR